MKTWKYCSKIFTYFTMKKLKLRIFSTLTTYIYSLCFFAVQVVPDWNVLYFIDFLAPTDAIFLENLFIVVICFRMLILDICVLYICQPSILNNTFPSVSCGTYSNITPRNLFWFPRGVCKVYIEGCHCYPCHNQKKNSNNDD